VDATVTLIKRTARGIKWYDAHRSHVDQLSAMNNSHLKVTLAVLILNVVWLFPWAWLSVVYPGYGVVFVVVAYVPLVGITFLFGAGTKSLSY
jgi:Fuc2NAc and GlcNAc transferase